MLLKPFEAEQFSADGGFDGPGVNLTIGAEAKRFQPSRPRVSAGLATDGRRGP
jgi:hypothetical protein